MQAHTCIWRPHNSSYQQGTKCSTHLVVPAGDFGTTFILGCYEEVWQWMSRSPSWRQPSSAQSSTSISLHMQDEALQSMGSVRT